MLATMSGCSAREGAEASPRSAPPKEWCARVLETFERCKRKALIDFPVEATALA